MTDTPKTAEQVVREALLDGVDVVFAGDAFTSQCEAIVAALRAAGLLREGGDHPEQPFHSVRAFFLNEGMFSGLDYPDRIERAGKLARKFVERVIVPEGLAYRVPGVVTDDMVSRAHEVLGVAWFEPGGNSQPPSAEAVRAALEAAGVGAQVDDCMCGHLGRAKGAVRDDE